MIVTVSGRQSGKTTKMIQWLLDGHEIEEYPGWSRVIVCISHAEVVRISKLVRAATADWPETRRTWDLRKAIWFPTDTKGRNPGVEFGVDNAELFLSRLLGFTPTKVTMTGELDA